MKSFFRASLILVGFAFYASGVLFAQDAPPDPPIAPIAPTAPPIPTEPAEPPLQPAPEANPSAEPSPSLQAETEVSLPADPEDAAVVDKVLANVNDHPVFLSAYVERYRDAAAQIVRDHRGSATLASKIQAMRTTLFRDMLREEILLERAKAIGLEESQIVEQYREDFKTRNKIPSDEELTRLLAEQSMTMNEFREQIRRSSIPQYVVRRDVAARTKVTPEETRAYYDANPSLYRLNFSYKVGVYFVPGATPEAEDAAYLLAQRLQGGVSRPDVLREFNLDKTQGLPETFAKGDLMPELERVVMALPAGTVSDPVPTDRGYYIVHVLERPGGESQPFEDVKAKIEEDLREKKFDEKLDEYFAEMEKLYFVEKYEEYPEKYLP